MRKILIALCLALCLTGCGKPANVSEDVYNLGLKAVDVTEQFLAADLTVDEAYEKLDDIEDRAIIDEDYPKDSSVKGKIGTLAWDVHKSDDVSDGTQVVKDELDKLKSYLGK
ncbi:hypothetical protein [Anaerotignum sp.]|uniref:hypothetical protein n=1 Tax=Anaerotignum sp. TaxID=2039241 RepID=UPI0027154268|nr:hypothetical protein [Anaerotignum sp.]